MKKVFKLLAPICILLLFLTIFVGCVGNGAHSENSTENKSDNGIEGSGTVTEDPCDSHTFDEGVTTKEPYCGNDGEITFTCKVCGFTKVESIPAEAEHAFSEKGEVVTPATCTEKGLRRFTCTVCGTVKEEEIDTVEGHAYDEGVVTKEPTCYEEGVRLLTCTLCGFTLERTEEILPSAYTVAMDGFGEFMVPESGVYKLPNPEKLGFAFVKWVDGEGNDFASEGVITSDIVVFPVFEPLETKTVDELEERAAAGVETIFIVNDIVIDRTIYFTGKTNIISSKEIRLIRHEGFAGDMIVVGEDSEGKQSVLENGIAELKLGSADGSSAIIIDGNRDNMKTPVVGSAIFTVNSSGVVMYDGVSISNHMKAGNERTLLWKDYIGSSCTMGGAAIFIAHGRFDMYGGKIENNSVNIENVGQNGENDYISSFGGAIYNFGTFNMYGGVIRNNSAVRGGAIYTRKQINILAGVIENNIAYNKGGAICTSESPFAEVFLGSNGVEAGTVVFKSNVAISQGGVLLGYHYSPIMVLGGVLFENNRAEGSVGGVIATAGPVTVRDSVFKGNYAFESGGAIYQYYIGEGFAAHAVELEGCLFEGNEAGRGGVMLISAVDGQKKASTVTVSNCEFRNNSAVKREKESVNPETGETEIKLSYGSGGVIYVTKKTKLTIKNSTFEGNSAKVNAGALYLTTDTVTSIKGSSFSGNNATVYGGVVYAAELKSLSITSCEFDSNGLMENGAYATERGGAIYTADSTVTTLDCRFIGNRAAIGGAVYVAGKGAYVDKAKTSGETVLHSIFEGNISGKGGAVCAYGKAELGGAELIGNVADENGGAVYGGSNAVIVADGCCFDKNKVSVPESAADLKHFGGAVYVINASLTVKNSSFAENGFEIADGATGIKTYGGALSASGTSSLMVSGTKFESNTSDYGGAIAAYSMGGNELNATGLTFKGNASNNCGGAMYINEAKTTLTNIVAENNSSKSGGAFYVSETREVKVGGSSKFKANTATLNGGAWFIGEAATVSDASSEFDLNTAVNGGAIYINSSKKTDEQSGEVTVERGEASLVGTIFTGNKANIDEKDSRGGAILVSGGKVFAENVKFEDNLATYYGGAIVGNTDSVIDLGKVSFINNSAGNNGGAIWAYFGSEIIAKGIEAKGNVSGGNGGVIYTRGNVKVLSGDGVENIFGGADAKEHNTAIGGGVIFVLGPEGEGETSNIELSGVKFIGNTATENGGAVNLTRSSLKAENCTFEGNGSNKYGGALHLSASDAEFEGSSFKNNSALDNGGAVYVTQVSEDKAIRTEKCSFEGNTTGKNGGAIYVTGTGAYVDGGKSENGGGSSFSSNSALGGGAIYAYGSVKLNYTRLEGNIAEAGGAIGVNVTKLSEDETTGEIVYSAGEIILCGAELKLNKALTEKENAEANGGAIYVFKGASVSDEDSVYSYNGATKGGAIYVEKASGSAFGTLSLVGSSFDSNESLSHGGAICVYNGADLGVKGCTFNNNKTEGVEANGGAMYIYATATTIENNKFVSNTSAYRGGAIYLSETPEGAVVTLGCEFKSNSAIDNGGAVYLTGTAVWRDGASDTSLGGSLFEGNSAAEGGAVMTHGSAELYNTRFSGNKAEGLGVLTVGNGRLTMTGGDISGNDRGVYAKYGSFAIRGATVINENTESNVYLSKGVFITLIGELDESAKIGISAEGYNRVMVKGDGEGVADASAYIDRFASDSDMPVYANGNGDLLMGYIILEQPCALNNYTVSVPGDPSFAWHTYSDGAVGEAITGQNTSTLQGVSGESYVCLITYESGEILTSEPVIYAERISQPICGPVCDCDEKHESIELIPITSESDLVLAAGIDGNYYLYKDVDTRNKILIKANVTLSLNGKTLRYVGENKASVIEIGEGASLTITDGEADDTVGYIDPESDFWIEGAYSGEGSVTEVTIRGGIITGGHASNGGAIYAKGDLTVYGGNFINNTSNHGGAIFVSTGASANIRNASFVGNLATVQGGAIRAYETEISIFDCTFIGNRATASEQSTNHQGGAIHIYKSSATIENSVFLSNLAGYRGGAIYATQTPEGGEIVTRGCELVGNSAGENGGAIYLTGTSTYRDGDKGGDNGSSFENNTATSGGAIMSHGSVILNGSVFVNNTATSGGAVYVGGGSFNDLGSSYACNKAELGGAVYAAAKIELAGASFDSNEANSGGAIYADADVKLTDSLFTFNTANADESESEACGGAIYLSEGVTVEDEDSTYSGNSAEKGGAIYLEKKEERESGAAYAGSGVVFDKNSASSYGGAACAYHFADLYLENATVIGNTSGNNGGAIWAYTDSSVTVKGIVAKGNVSSLNGGVIYTRGDLYILSGDGVENIFGGRDEGDGNLAKNGGVVYLYGHTEDKLSESEITGAAFIGNKATENGGAICTNLGSVIVSDAAFEGNGAEKHGGAIHSTLTVIAADRCGFVSNTANNNGGAIYSTQSTAALTVTTVSCIFEGNSAKAYGGAIYVTGTGAYTDGNEAEKSGSTFNNNIANSGGAIFVYGSAELKGSVVTNNTAIQGGAVYVAVTEISAATDTEKAKYSLGKLTIDGAKLELNGATVESSGSENNGGAIYANAAEIAIYNSSFIKNFASYRGGAVYLTKNSVEMVTSGCTFTENSAVNNGGAIYLTGTAIYRDGDKDGDNGSSFENNTATSGGAIMSYGSATLNGSEFKGNAASESGAAIYSAKELEVTDSTFEGNASVKSGGAIYAVGKLSVNGGKMSGNKVTGSISDYLYMGGGIAVGADTDAEIKNVSFISNVGGASGGAIAGYGASSTINVEDCYFEGNSASNGGAIYAGGKSVFTVTDITAKSNKATTYGAIIYVTSAGTTLTINSITLYNNNTAKGTDCGMAHLANASATLNVYTDAVIMLDTATEKEIEIGDWSSLLLNPKNGTVNQLTASTEG